MDSKYINARKIFKVYIAATILFAAMGCKSRIEGVSNHYDYKTECIGSEFNGTILVKAWGFGMNEKEAVEQAKKNALKEVLFSGLYNGKEDCGTVPILTEVNSYQKRKKHFDSFFSDKGDYRDFVKYQKTKNNPVLKPGTSGVTAGVVIEILKAELKEKMSKDVQN